MLSLSPPKGFSPRFEVSGVFVENEGRILLLRRHPNKPQGSTWGMPAGKTHGTESAKTCMTRELKEETGIDLSDEALEFIVTTYVQYEDYHFVYHLFRLPVSTNVAIRINPEEHTEFQWVSPEDALRLNLIQELDACIRLCYHVH